MKAKHVIWFFAAIIGIVTMAAGIAVIVDRFFPERLENHGYIACDCDSDDE